MNSTSSCFLLIYGYMYGFVNILACQTSNIIPPIQGHYCVREGYRNITNLPRHLCVHRCVTSPDNCAAVSYNYEGRYCLLVPRSCDYTRRDANFVYIITNPTCVVWIPHQPGSSYPENAVRNDRVILGRAFFGDDALLVGTIFPEDDIIKIRVDRLYTLTDYEVLVVMPPCTVSWRYTTTSNPTLHAGALVGGYLNHSREVYIGRWSNVYRTYGYYDVGVYLYFWGGRITYFDLLSIHEP